MIVLPKIFFASRIDSHVSGGADKVLSNTPDTLTSDFPGGEARRRFKSTFYCIRVLSVVRSLFFLFGENSMCSVGVGFF